ncbi:MULTISPECIES: exodeoxyribonuclease VII small subunit [Priestia]|jgi:exodeoxyribonuclease VII small subunit|uniref:exodeoxyribonuclease VII small subunit n=1 Tax=Priestia TaxID=2800373 RepID=UPI00094C557D|nr:MULTISPECIES: exodeoxyribonuclease VII small subunit [Priestia]MBY0092614.1 exodeoxyribonuclease VII small subunit [Priestia aryabhattai]MBY0103057.1 exodeoxyribonuclease VII small subunit [Priestia aryabhattai]MCM3097255.1 exodeoxyribonuclease VII small subunit [Priestia megaterium]MCM3304952.1 exodeoxyribonuclease VII small subunit [Priestia megaterium]MED4027052.1 exodeoxyribonuclease VII small subunit [Priestia megaterium]
MATNKEYTFEEAMEQLETIVNKLEEGDVPLEEAIQQFQQGMTLSKFCHDRLQHIEKQMETILREDGTLEPFSVQEEE